MIWKFSSEDGQSVSFPELPTWTQFKVALQETTIQLSSHFEQEYFNPAIFALRRCLNQPDFDKEAQPYCAFKHEGILMWWEGFQC